MYNINPKIWGSSGWEFMHYITLAYPDNPTQEEKDNIRMFFSSVGKVLPCESCRVNFSKHLLKYPLNELVISNRNNLVRWLYNIHNEVNIMHNKEVFSFEKFISKYMFREDTNDTSNKVILAGLLALIIIVIILRNKT